MAISQSKWIRKYRLVISQFSRSIKWGYELLRRSNAINNVNFPTKQLKEVCSISSGGIPNRNHEEYYNGNTPWVKTGEVVNDVVFDADKKIKEIKQQSKQLIMSLKKRHLEHKTKVE